ncbi:hypothetical protein HZS_207 [Henneguya salminicola]|nr:hypothetical protein HZS_207 [Henneguya salminicola]
MKLEFLNTVTPLNNIEIRLKICAQILRLKTINQHTNINYRHSTKSKLIYFTPIFSIINVAQTQVSL